MFAAKASKGATRSAAMTTSMGVEIMMVGVSCGGGRELEERVRVRVREER